MLRFVSYRVILISLLFFLTLLSSQLCRAEEVLISTAHYSTGEIIPYILNYKNLSPKYMIILFPGGNGSVNPRMENGQLTYSKKGNFLLRSRTYIVDEEFSTIVTDATPSKDRVQAILNDINDRFPNTQIYLMGTSNGTYDTLDLAEYLSDRIAGEIHTSSLNRIAFFNASKYKNRHLIVHHQNDSCHVTPFSAAKSSQDTYGNELIIMDGGTSTGEPCEAFSYHGYHGIEKETINAIKHWIKQTR